MTPSAATAPLTVRRAAPLDLAAVLDLLREAGLSLPGVEEHFANFSVALRGNTVVGAIGLELRGPHALLRSAVVAPHERGTGLGGALYAAAVEHARREGVGTLVLLTTTAEGYWARHGFARITRDAVPEEVKRSHEFRGACPASAAVMARPLT